jgi:hypothetical protein
MIFRIIDVDRGHDLQDRDSAIREHIVEKVKGFTKLGRCQKMNRLAIHIASQSLDYRIEAVAHNVDRFL